MPSIFGEGDPIFDANPRAVSWFMSRIQAKELALPDFQRDFVWDPAAVRDLLVSIMSRFPAGALLLLEQGTDPGFKPRAVSDAPEINSTDNPKLLVLDGQQRLTSLYQAHSGTGDARYLIDLSGLVDNANSLDVDFLDFDEIVTFEAVKKNKPLASDNPAWQYENWTYPVHSFLVEGFDAWVNLAVEHNSDGDAAADGKRRVRLAEIRKALLDPLGTYSFPTIELGDTTSMVAVCKIFETLNLKGIKLSVFELLTARVWAYGHDLRKLWAEAEDQYPVLADFKVDPYRVLQAVSLRSSGSAQRSGVLALETAQLSDHWDSVIEGYAGALELIRDQCWVQAEKWLPYAAIPIPIAAVWNRVEALKGPKAGDARDRLKQYFWCTVFMTNFDQGGNSQAEADFLKLKDWVIDESAPEPEAVAEFQFSTGQLTAARRNRRALYRGLMALIMNSRALDLHTRERITTARISSQKIDAHHLFPRNWLAENYHFKGEESLSQDLILNFTLIDATTNKVISDNPPSDYLAAITHESPGIDQAKILESHIIGSQAREALETDEYDDFISARADDVATEIEKATNRPVARDAE